jgi:hypothetical protein
MPGGTGKRRHNSSAEALRNAANGPESPKKVLPCSAETGCRAGTVAGDEHTPALVHCRGGFVARECWGHFLQRCFISHDASRSREKKASPESIISRRSTYWCLPLPTILLILISFELSIVAFTLI